MDYATLKNTEIPWNISIKYFIDGKELSPQEAAGKSGALEIRISITENEKCASDIYENYALQCSFTLDTEKCGNISAEGATVANVGKNKQITYTVLPDKGLEKSVFADVTDFEMAADSVNGIKMSLGLDLGDEDIEEKINSLTDGAKELMDGATELSDGTGELRSETDKIDDTFSDDLSGVLDSISDDGFEVKSFVSEKNTEVTSVQFVIKTDPVEISEAEEENAAEEEHLNFWQKLLRLFGLY